jgi:Bacterial RNA polymerase, alpha chain C terminal domain
MKRPPWSSSNEDIQLADMLVHEAGHAVVAWELGIEIVHVRFSMQQWSGLMRFAGGLYRFNGDDASDDARVAAETDMLIFHAGQMAQRLFHYDGAHRAASLVDLTGIMDAGKTVEDDTALIDAWSEYIEERVRVMLCQPATWARVIALAPEIARHLYLPGRQIASFLLSVDVSGAVSPKDVQRWKRDVYPLGQPIQVLQLSNRTRSCLERSEIETLAELISYSPWDLRWSMSRAGDKTVAELTEAVRRVGLELAADRRTDREERVRRARLEEREAPPPGMVIGDSGGGASWHR